MSKQSRNVYAEVTERIVESLENGVAPWVRPWRADGPHRNGNSQRPYTGVNPWLLEIQGFGSREWFTYKGAKKVGGQVRKGERGTMVVFWKVITKDVEDKETGEVERKKIFFLRHYFVFNREQIDGLPEEIIPEVEVPALEEIDAIVEATGAKIIYGGDRAAYSPFSDEIRMPERDRFEDSASFYAAEFHELGHWTAPRVKRELPSDGFGTEAYAKEELVAEIASAYLSERVGLDGRLQHPEYIAHWIKVLKEDERAIFSAAKQARIAAEYILPSEEAEDESEDEQAVA